MLIFLVISFSLLVQHFELGMTHIMYCTYLSETCKKSFWLITDTYAAKCKLDRLTFCRLLRDLLKYLDWLFSPSNKLVKDLSIFSEASLDWNNSFLLFGLNIHSYLECTSAKLRITYKVHISLATYKSSVSASKTLDFDKKQSN